MTSADQPSRPATEASARRAQGSRHLDSRTAPAHTAAAIPSSMATAGQPAIAPPAPAAPLDGMAARAEHATPAPTAPADTPRPLPTIQDIWRAQGVIRTHIYHTPLLASRTISELSGAIVHLKAENLQRSGAYKIRGATYKLSRLTPSERRNGVIAASAGNHAQGVAIAASALSIPCTIVMPVSAPLAKVMATQGYGAHVELAGDTYNEAYARARELAEQSGATYIHAFDDPDIIAGQGTLGLEILSDLPDVEAVVVGIGGGGLISGIATAIKALKPDVRIYGVQASGAASMRAALDAGHLVTLSGINTIADGIATKSAGEYTFRIVRALVDDVVTVADEHIIDAVLLLMERGKLLVEGAGAVGVAALMAGRLRLEGKRTVVVLSGGNIDMNLVSRFIQRGLAAQGRYLVIHTLLPDRPGELLRLLNIIAAQRVNVLDVVHHRTGPLLPINEVAVELTLETRNRAHCEELLAVLRAHGLQVTAAVPTRTT